MHKRASIATLMKKGAIEARCRHPNISKPAPGHMIYPYWLRKLPIVRPSQVRETGGLAPLGPPACPLTATPLARPWNTPKHNSR